MTPTLGMYSMNMNGWQGLFQQGLGMLGGSSMGYGNYSSFGGSGIFTNCFGEPNYDAMAGYGVANALLGVAGQAIAANRKEKAPEVNYTQELSKISKEIETKEIDKAEQTDIINTKTDEIKTATDTKTKLTGDLKTAESNLNAYKKELNDATSLTEEQRNTIESKIAQAEKDVKAIEENGGVVVAFENCSGAKSVDRLIDENDPDIYEAIARRYLNIGCSVMTPNPNRFELLNELIDEYQVEAVVEMTLQACHTYNVEAGKVGRFVREEKKIPYLHVETDYSQSDVGQLNTRIAALIEML